MDSKIDDRSFTYRLDEDNRIFFVNEDWLAFARENDAPGLTRETVLDQPIASFIDDWETFHLYELIFRRVRMTGLQITLPFRCDTPAIRRFMQLSIRLLGDGALELTGRILAVEERNFVALLDPAAPRSKRMVTICSWCKRVKTTNDIYVEVEQALASLRLFGSQTPWLTHGVCPECFDRIRRELDL